MSRVPDDEPNDDRRAFLKKCGTFAAITPPAVTFLLSTSLSSKAIAASGGGGRVPVEAVVPLVVGAGTGVALAPHPAAAAPVQAAPAAAPPPPAAVAPPPPPPTQLSPAVIRAGERG